MHSAPLRAPPILFLFFIIRSKCSCREQQQRSRVLAQHLYFDALKIKYLPGRWHRPQDPPPPATPCNGQRPTQRGLSATAKPRISDLHLDRTYSFFQLRDVAVSRKTRLCPPQPSRFVSLRFVRPQQCTSGDVTLAARPSRVRAAVDRAEIARRVRRSRGDGTSSTEIARRSHVECGDRAEIARRLGRSLEPVAHAACCLLPAACCLLPAEPRAGGARGCSRS